MSPNEQAAHDAFQAYCDAKTISERTMRFEDAHETGRAWVRFLNTFLPPDQQMALMPLPGSNIVQFPKRYEVAR